MAKSEVRSNAAWKDCKWPLIHIFPYQVILWSIFAKELIKIGKCHIEHHSKLENVGCPRPRRCPLDVAELWPTHLLYYPVKYKYNTLVHILEFSRISRGSQVIGQTSFLRLAAWWPYWISDQPEMQSQHILDRGESTLKTWRYLKAFPSYWSDIECYPSLETKLNVLRPYIFALHIQTGTNKLWWKWWCARAKVGHSVL